MLQCAKLIQFERRYITLLNTGDYTMSRRENLANMVDSLVKQDLEAATAAFKAAAQEMGKEILNTPTPAPNTPHDGNSDT